MDPLTHVIAQASDGGTLLGIAAIITAVGTILAVLRSYLKKDGDDGISAELAADARERIRLLKETIADLERSLQQCRSERQVMTAEGRLKDMHIGTLEARLADARWRLEEYERER